MVMAFTGKVVLVTGASAGIGEQIALEFAEGGARLSLAGRNEEALRRVAAACREAGAADALPVPVDLATDLGCETLAAQTLQHFGRLDVLVNNAAVGSRTCIQLADMETFDRVFATNVRGVYNLTRLLVPALIETKGNIVNVSSISGSMASVGSLPYSMSKAALDHFTKCVALELAPKGVRVNTVSPGVTVSTFVQRLTGYTNEQYLCWLTEAARGIPMGHVSQPRSIARVVTMLASEASSDVTGVILPVDCGLSLAGQGNSDLMKRQMKKPDV